MTRVTPPVAKLARTLASAPSIPRPYYATKTASSAAALARSELLGSESRHDDHHHRRSMTTQHRPTPMPVPSAHRTVPLMQGFKTSAAPAARSTTLGTMDSAVLPPMHAAVDSFSGPRVPLLPDNFFPDRSSSLFGGSHSPEAADAPLATPVVVAANPGNVYSAITEVEGFGVDGVDVSFAHGGPIMVETEGHGMIKDMWKGLVDDVFGEKKPALA